MKAALSLLFICCGLTLGLTPRDSWILAPGAEDLIAGAGWECLPGVTSQLGAINLAAGDNYNTTVNASGPALSVHGDFGVLATLIPAPDSSTFLTLVGALGGSTWWQGLKRLDVGIVGSTVVTNVWMGASPNAAGRTFALPDGVQPPYTLEAACTGGQFVVTVNTAEAGRIDDPGVFDSSRVFLGFNVAPHGSLSVQALAAEIPNDGSAQLALSAPYLHVAARTTTALREAATQKGLLVGAAVNPALFSNDAYAETLGREFNMVVPENDLKFGPTHPARDRYTFCAADRIVAFAQANDMRVRGHTLVWQQGLPDWLSKGNFSPDEAASILQDHIATVVTHFKGKLYSWDVVNEAIAYGAPYGPQPSYWLTALGPGYVDQAFYWAKQSDPDVKLFYNETGGEGLGSKADVLYSLVKGLLDRGVPLDGVGLQMHVDLRFAPTYDQLSANFQRLAALGLEIHITEMDVRIRVPATDADLAAQAAIYRNVTSACQANPNCKALLTWGISDAYSWIPGSYPGFGSALLFDEKFQPKPAYQAVMQVLSK